MIVPGSGNMFSYTPYREGILGSAVADGNTSKYWNSYDSTETTNPYWKAYFEETISIGVFNYTWNPNAVADTGVLSTKTVLCDITRDFFIRSYTKSDIGDLGEIDCEFLDNSNNVIVAIRTQADGNYSSGLWYGSSLSSLTKTGLTGSYGHTNGVFVLSATNLTYTRTPGGADSNGYNNDFVYSVNCSTVVKVRISSLRAKSNYTGGTATAMVFIKYNKII